MVLDWDSHLAISVQLGSIEEDDHCIEATRLSKIQQSGKSYQQGGIAWDWRSGKNNPASA